MQASRRGQDARSDPVLGDGPRDEAGGEGDGDKISGGELTAADDSRGNEEDPGEKSDERGFHVLTGLILGEPAHARKVSDFLTRGISSWQTINPPAPAWSGPVMTEPHVPRRSRAGVNGCFPKDKSIAG
jgi:hypothetical protein